MFGFEKVREETNREYQIGLEKAGSVGCMYTADTLARHLAKAMAGRAIL